MISFHPWQCFQTSAGSGMFLRIPTLLPWWPKFPPPPPPDHNADFLPDFLHFYFLFHICPIFTLHRRQRSAKIFNGSQSQHMIRATRSKNARQLNKLPSQKPSLFSISRSGKIKSQGWWNFCHLFKYSDNGHMFNVKMCPQSHHHVLKFHVLHIFLNSWCPSIQNSYILCPWDQIWTSKKMYVNWLS